MLSQHINYVPNTNVVPKGSGDQQSVYSTGTKRSIDLDDERNNNKKNRKSPRGSGGGLFSWLTGGSNNSSVVKRNRNGKTRHVRFKDSNNGGGKNKTRKVREWRW